MQNSLIGSGLKSKRDEFVTAFKSVDNTNALFNELFAELESFDFGRFKRELTEEIQTNLKEWWTNPAKGIVASEKLQAIVFEYDYYIFVADPEAMSYGIINWQDFQPQTEELSMGYEYEFSTEFEAAPGLTLKYFSPLEKLATENLPEELKSADIYYEAGYDELIGAYTYSGLVAIHEVFVALEKQGAFKSLNTEKGFMMLIGEHDSGGVHPVLIIE